jgi:hypothetical protein
MVLLGTQMVKSCLVFFLSAAVGIRWAQSAVPLRERVLKPDPGKYRQIQDGRDWKNPYLVVHRDGVEIVGLTPAEHLIPVELVGSELERLPDSAWPYGLVVAVQDNSLLRSSRDLPQIRANRGMLLQLLKRRGITADLWP